MSRQILTTARRHKHQNSHRTVWGAELLATVLLWSMLVLGIVGIAQTASNYVGTVASKVPATAHK